MRVIQIVTASSAGLHNILTPNAKAELCSLCCAPVVHSLIQRTLSTCFRLFKISCICLNSQGSCINAQDSWEKPSSLLQEALLFSSFITASPAWQSEEVIDFLPWPTLIHIKPNTETIFYSECS